MNFSSPDQALDFAVKNEEEAEAFYMDLATKVQAPHLKEIFEGFAGEERGHKAKLLQVKEGKKLLGAASRVVDLKIADYLVQARPEPNMSYSDALVLAMQKEKAAFRLYSDLASAAGEGVLRELFLGLAQEEAKHKLRFEIEYDDEVMKEN